MLGTEPDRPPNRAPRPPPQAAEVVYHIPRLPASNQDLTGGKPREGRFCSLTLLEGVTNFTRPIAGR